VRRVAGPLLAALLAAACGGPSVRHAGPGAAPPAVPSPAERAPSRAEGVVSAADRLYADGAAALEAGSVERALEFFAEAWKESPGHAGADRDFAPALARLKSRGDEAARQGRVEGAGKAWAATLRLMSHPAAKGKALSFTRADLRANIDRLSENLLEKGLVEYREGRIESAIAHWQKILSYEPSHAEAAKSVRTATTQLENLKKITPPAPAK
jgi:tetratricopeptide (TPR) repeat protein